MELENKMLLDSYWLDYSETVEEEDRESDEEWLARIIEEEEEENGLSWYEWSRLNDGYRL